MSRRSRASKVIATGVSVSATLAGVGIIAHADSTPSNDQTTAPGPSAVPVAATSGTASTLATVVTATTVLGRPGPALLPTKSTEPALAVPVVSYDTEPTVLPSLAVDTTTVQPPGIPATTAVRNGSATPDTAGTPSTEPVPVAAATTEAPPTETTVAPPPPPVTTAPPPPPATLPPLTAPPDDTSRGTT